HPGRVRDNMDFGRVFFVRTQAARQVGGFSAEYPHGYLYDFRLRMSEKFDLRLISNRYSGALYEVADRGKEHNVFDYLLSSKEVQQEMERIVTAHLQRIGAYLPPGGYEKVTYTPEEEAAFKDCLASVVIPVNNRPQFIGKAIESVLNQTVREVEAIVVVNGGEEDPTIGVVKSYMPGGERYRQDLPPVRLIVHDINNIGLCLNSGIQAARGKYYVQLDSDDRLKPFAVEKLLEVFDSDPHVGMVIGSYEVWQLEDDGRYYRREDIPVVTHDEWTEENGRNNLLRINGAGAPRSAHIKVLREMGWFSVNDIPYSRNYGEDYEMVLKVSEKYRIGRVWEPIYEVVRHSGGTDHAIDQETIDRNDNAKDHMRLEAIRRRQELNRKRGKISAQD
ncbi:MAG TPA: glycosyltransferase family 2 protein, partial [Bacteroidetes bacterium]|nr:glycosyltransferase family 2 protein [Bacteroidota bacterium]